jgi:hypothetical protein
MKFLLIVPEDIIGDILKYIALKGLVEGSDNTIKISIKTFEEYIEVRRINLVEIIKFLDKILSDICQAPLVEIILIHNSDIEEKSERIIPGIFVLLGATKDKPFVRIFY